jgi:2'-deoxynucleoside 5'-phosphate N-hydrolase
MIVYCAGAIKGDASFKEYYKEIVKIVKSFQHAALSEMNPEFHSAIPLTDNQIFQRDIKWLEKSNMMIAEISGPSLGVGFEISYALNVRKIPVLAVYNAEIEKVSSMIAGCDSELLSIRKYYNNSELKDIVKGFLNQQSEI